MVANPKDAKNFPAPNAYEPVFSSNQKLEHEHYLTKVMGGRDYKRFREADKAKTSQQKERVKAERDRVADLKDTLGDKVPDLAEPIPQAYQTFDKWRKYYKINKPNPRQKKAPGFGLADRFGLDEKAKYQREIKLFNEGNTIGKELDPKSDPVPGPGHYKLAEVWNGKKVKMRRPYSAQPQPGEKILKSISKGPTCSIYYQK